MTTWAYRCIIVPDSLVTYARDLTASVAGEAGTGMYSAALSPTGAEPVTHWMSAGLITDQFASLLPLTSYPADEEPIHTPGCPEIVAGIATANGYPTTAEAVAKLLDAADITEHDAQQAQARLGVTMVQPAQ